MEKIVYLFVAVCALSCTYGIPVKDKSVSTRILDGVQAGNTQFLYTVSLQRVISQPQTDPTRGHVCGGVLITYQHVLTAASCTFTVNSTGFVVPIVPSAYRVFAGSRNLTNDESPNSIRPIANFTRHPQYIGAPAYYNDIAIITLTAPFPAETVHPLSLPSFDFQPSDLTQCTVAGWGAATLGSSTPSTQLLFTTKYIYNQELCTTIHNGLISSPNIFPTMVCAASYNILSTGCHGDEGNALVCDGILTGISFFTDQCQQSSFPELYTRVSNYSTWIRTISASDTFKPGAYILIAFTVLHGFLQKNVLN